jgi:hypothetical protein
VAEGELESGGPWAGLPGGYLRIAHTEIDSLSDMTIVFGCVKVTCRS